MNRKAKGSGFKMAMKKYGKGKNPIQTDSPMNFMSTGNWMRKTGSKSDIGGVGDIGGSYNDQYTQVRRTGGGIIPGMSSFSPPPDSKNIYNSQVAHLNRRQNRKEKRHGYNPSINSTR